MSVYGNRNARRKLTEHDVRLIRRLRSDGLTCRELGEKFEVSPTAIHKIATYENWPHVRLEIKS